MHTIWQDIRYALRQLKAHPGFALTAIVSLALGIGATVSVFSVIYAVTVNPYPYAQPERMAHLQLQDKDGSYRYVQMAASQLPVLEKVAQIQSVAAWDYRSLVVTGRDLPENVDTLFMAPHTFETFGAAPQLGRNLGPSDNPYGQEPAPVAVLSNKFWMRHYNGDPAVLGRTLELAHKSYTIVGIAQPRFAWGDADVYLPLKMTSDPNTSYSTTIRLKPGVSFAEANAALEPLMHEFAKETPAHFPKQFKVTLRGMNDEFMHQIGATLFLLFGGVALLLAIGCGNVSILLLARGTAREQEFAVRSALGASRKRIVRQLLTESLLLSLSGVGLGVLLAYRALSLIVAWLPQYSFPHEADIRINLPVLLFSAGLGILTGILFGFFPALQLARPDINQTMQASSRKVSGGARGKRMHNLLIAGQIALTLLLLTAASAAIEGFLRTLRVPLGYDPHNVVSFSIPVQDGTYDSRAQRIAYFEKLRQQAASVPGVALTGITLNGTPPANGLTTAVDMLGKPSSEEQKASVNMTDAKYFSVLGIPLRKGRLWSESEIERGVPLALVNETFVKRYYPNEDVLGHSVRVPIFKNPPPAAAVSPGADGWIQIVGVVGDAVNDGLDKPVQPAIYLPYSTLAFPFIQVLAKSRTSTQAIMQPVRQQIAKVNPEQQANGVDFEEVIRRQPEWARGRLISVLFAAFSGLALVLATVGLYSVVSYSVAQRTNEFGIRMALGAEKKHVFRIVFASAAVSVGTGLGIGLLLSIGLRHLLAQWTSSGDHTLLLALGVCFLLVAAAAVACLLPARKASSVEPASALRI